MNKETTMASLKEMNWAYIRGEIQGKLFAIQATVQKAPLTPVTDRLANEAIMPLMRLLTEFCQRIVVEGREVRLFDDLKSALAYKPKKKPFPEGNCRLGLN